MSWTGYDSREDLFAGAAAAIAADLDTALAGQKRVSFAVPGGTTPGPIFDILAQTPLAWDRVDVMLTDERWVPETHSRSNSALIRSRLLTGAAATATFIAFYRDGAAEKHVPKVAAELETALPLDVVVLGMGADMHTASLFPGAPGLAEALAPDAPPLNILRPESQPDLRVSLSGPALANAKAKHLLITGTEKKQAWEQAQSLPYSQAPVRVVADGLQIHWSE